MLPLRAIPISFAYTSVFRSGAFWACMSDTPCLPVPTLRIYRAFQQRRSYRRIIELLVEARKEADITQVELGRRLGQRQTFVSKFELGERRLDVAEFIEVCRAIGTGPHEIMREAGVR